MVFFDSVFAVVPALPSHNISITWTVEIVSFEENSGWRISPNIYYRITENICILRMIPFLVTISESLRMRFPIGIG
ncbi:hypothetical protein [Candidatus Nitrosocosmicus sp. T]